MNLVSTSDVAITVAYFCIPVQILFSLWKSPPHRIIPLKLVVTLVLFALFIFLCGAGHLMRFLGLNHTTAFVYVNVATASVSMLTAIYLIPLIPCMFSLLDESLNKLTNESKESKSKLLTFMSFLCHEIRNPLFAITSSAEFLKDTNLHPDQVEEVFSICDSSLLMLRLVNDVLDLSKLDSGKLELEAREFDLHSLLRRLGDNMTRQVDRKHQGAVHMVCEVTPEVPRIICGDSTRILQIVYNLLSNSIKFTSQGKIELLVRLENEDVEAEEREAAHRAEAHTVTMSSDRPMAFLSNDLTEQPLLGMGLLDGGDSNDTDIEGGDVLRQNNDDEDIMILSISVADSGIGIPTERLNTIFEPYTQAKLSDFRQHGGTGLGLSIISSLTKTMGGNISVTSKGGEGSRFHLKMPVRVPRNPTLAATPEDIGGSQSKDFNQSLESRRLPVYEDSTKVTTSGSDLPVLPGVQGASTSHQGASAGCAELFSLTANGPTGLMSAAHPILMVDSSIMGLTRRGSLRRDTPSSYKATPSLPLFDFAPKSNVVLVVDDNSVNRKILGKMLSLYKLEYETACNGQEAVDTLLASRNATGDMSCPHFGLVFMDVSMPVMDGNVATETIRKAKLSVPIVSLSANVLSQERDHSIFLGANESHTKPILRSDLHKLCTRFLCRNGDQPPASPSQQPSRYHDQAPQEQGMFSKGITPSVISRTPPESSNSSAPDRLNYRNISHLTTATAGGSLCVGPP